MAGLKSQLVEKRGELDAKRKKLGEIFAEAGKDMDMDKVKVIDGDTAAKVDFIRSLNAEVADLSKSVDSMVEAIKAQEGFDAEGEHREYEGKGLTHADGGGRAPRVKSLGEYFAESQAYKEGQDKKSVQVEIDQHLKDLMGASEMKTLMTTSAGWTPETTRGPRVIDYVTRPIQVTDTIPTTTTNQVAIKYMEETTFTNAAAEVAEGGTKPEATLAFTERTSPVRKIAVWIPVTEEQLEDVAGIQSYIDNRLTFMVRQRLDSQILVGDGIAPNLKGILNTAGIQTQVTGTDPVPDAIYKAMVKIMLTGAGNGGAIPNALYMNPLDWQDIRLLRTADGIYIWGSPSEVGPARMWGLNVVLAEGLTQNTALVGDTSFVELAVKKGMTVKSTDSHQDYFIKNQLVILAEMRAALVVYRPAAWCQVTGV